MMSLLRQWRIWLCLVGIFVAGMGTGAIVTWKAARATSPALLENYARVMEVAMRRKVEILPEQEPEITRILEDAQKQLNEARDHTRRDVFAILDETHGRIRARLDDEQRARFDDFIRRHDRRED